MWSILFLKGKHSVPGDVSLSDQDKKKLNSREDEHPHEHNYDNPFLQHPPSSYPHPLSFLYG